MAHTLYLLPRRGTAPSWHDLVAAWHQIATPPLSLVPACDRLEAPLHATLRAGPLTVSLDLDSASELGFTARWVDDFGGPLRAAGELEALARAWVATDLLVTLGFSGGEAAPEMARALVVAVAQVFDADVTVAEVGLLPGVATGIYTIDMLRAASDETWRLELGSEYAPDSPWGLDVLTVGAGGRYRYENRRAGQVQRVRTGVLSQADHTRLLGWLRESGFPNVAEHRRLPGATYLTITRAAGDGEQRALVALSAAESMPGYGPLITALDAWVTDLRTRGDADAVLVVAADVLGRMRSTPARALILALLGRSGPVELLPRFEDLAEVEQRALVILGVTALGDGPSLDPPLEEAAIKWLTTVDLSLLVVDEFLAHWLAVTASAMAPASSRRLARHASTTRRWPARATQRAIVTLVRQGELESAEGLLSAMHWTRKHERALALLELALARGEGITAAVDAIERTEVIATGPDRGADEMYALEGVLDRLLETAGPLPNEVPDLVRRIASYGAQVSDGRAPPAGLDRWPPLRLGMPGRRRSVGRGSSSTPERSGTRSPSATKPRRRRWRSKRPNSDSSAVTRRRPRRARRRWLRTTRPGVPPPGSGRAPRRPRCACSGP